MIANSTHAVATPADVSSLVDELKVAWRSGQTPNAAAAIRDFPSILRYRSLVIDLAYEEYCLREEAGDTPDVDSFCATLPAFRSQMREVIRGHRELADHPELLAAAPWPNVGDELDGMPLVRELGRGAFARVYLAIDTGAGGRSVVLKVSQLSSAEANTLGPIEHPNVVSIHWAKQIDGLFVICMPFVAVTTLQDAIEALRLESPPTSKAIFSAIDAGLSGLSAQSAIRTPVLRNARQNVVASIVAIATPLANALAFLHRHRIYHGDLKPSNILLGRGGVPFLIDFNLASTAEAASVRLGGTLPYMAPERIRKLLDNNLDTFQAGPADTYSFAAVLFECLTGQLPHQPANGEKIQEIAKDLAARKCDAAPNLRDINPAVPNWIARLIEHCLDPDPGKRPTAQQIEAEFIKRQASRGHWRFAIGAAALIAGGFVASQAISMPSQSLSERAHVPVLTSPERIADPFERGVSYLRAGETELAMQALSEARRTNPDGRAFAYSGYCFSQRGRHDAAVDYYQKALDAGFNEAWVHNNRAYSLTQVKRDAVTLSLALKEVTLAHEMAPEHRSIKFNWAYIRFLTNYNSKTKRFKDDDCLRALAEVMAVGPYDADLYYVAGMILAAGSEAVEGKDLAVQYLKKAVELGKRPKSLVEDPVLKANLIDRQDFRALSTLTPGNPNPRALQLGLVNPTE